MGELFLKSPGEDFYSVHLPLCKKVTTLIFKFSISGACPTAEVKLPDGQRLAYRMDYVLKESGNTYISAITSHTAYWCNPDMAFFMLTKIHPELDKVVAERKNQIPVIVFKNGI